VFLEFAKSSRGNNSARSAGVQHLRQITNGQEATRTALMAVTVAVAGVAGCFLWERSQPAESQESGMANSDQPQSRQTLTSGDGDMGGWLRVRGELR
jgi:hypothetical protein